jgi:hypothetical protein
LIWKEAVECLESVKKALLNRVLRVLVGEHDRAAYGVGSTLMQPDQRSKCFTAPVLRRDHQCPLIGLSITG